LPILGAKKQTELDLQTLDKDEDKHIIFAIQESEPPNYMFNTSEEGQVFNFNNPDVNNSDEFDQYLIFYNWLTNSTMTSHFCN